ncbi:MAG: Fic family protein [Patescibacteria group bacterium]
MMKEKKTFQPLQSSGVCLIYKLLVKHGYVSFPITPQAEFKIDAIVSSITGAYFGEEIYKTHEEKALAYLYFLIKDHPFTDGNKRTASLAFEVVCDLNKLQPDYAGSTLDVWAVFIEKIHEQDHQSVIKMLSKVIFKT